MKPMRYQNALYLTDKPGEPSETTEKVPFLKKYQRSYAGFKI